MVSGPAPPRGSPDDRERQRTWGPINGRRRGTRWAPSGATPWVPLARTPRPRPTRRVVPGTSAGPWLPRRAVEGHSPASRSTWRRRSVTARLRADWAAIPEDLCELTGASLASLAPSQAPITYMQCLWSARLASRTAGDCGFTRAVASSNRAATLVGPG